MRIDNVSNVILNPVTLDPEVRVTLTYTFEHGSVTESEAAIGQMVVEALQHKARELRQGKDERTFELERLHHELKETNTKVRLLREKQADLRAQIGQWQSER